ncbi:MAG: Eco57I restriction-modification methylase domain-containing protein, partial [Nitrososphaerales archaeon]
LASIRAIYSESTRFISSSPVPVVTADFLAWQPAEGEKFDLIVGNLPFVKYETINRLSQRHGVKWIQRNFECFAGRADYSVAFIEKILGLLSDRGVVAMITSNRFTRAEYGLRLRKEVAKARYDVFEVDIHGIHPFDQKVSAYASLFLFKAGGSRLRRYAVLYSQKTEVIQALLANGLGRARSTDTFEVNPPGTISVEGRPWSPFPPTVVRMLRRISLRFKPVSDSGIVTRTGPATGADAVFVKPRSDFPLEQRTAQRFLRPLFPTNRDAQSAARTRTRSILALYDPVDDKLPPIDDLPADLQKYLRRHRPELKVRYIVRARQRSWWDTIDPVNPTLASTPKLMIPDLRKGSSIEMDSGHWFPSHSVVYCTGSRHQLERLKVALSSPLGDVYRTAFSPTLRGGAPRASSRMVAGFPLPHNLPLTKVQGPEDGWTETLAAYELSREEVDVLLSYSTM